MTLPLITVDPLSDKPELARTRRHQQEVAAIFNPMIRAGLIDFDPDTGEPTIIINLIGDIIAHQVFGP